MFCRSYSCKLQQPSKSERKLRKPKEKPSNKETRITFYPQGDSIYVTIWRKPPVHKTFKLESIVPPSIASHPEFITCREKALIARKLKEEPSVLPEKPEYTKQFFDKKSKYRRASSVYSSTLRPKSAKEAIYDSIFSDY